MMISLLALTLAAQTPEEIARRALESTMFAASDARATVALEISRDQKVIKKRELIAVVKREAGRSRSYVEFTSPSDVAGTRFLSVDEDGETKQFIFLPAFKKVKRIVGAQRTQSFVGTDFSYADLEGRSAGEWTWRALPDETIEGEAAHVIEGVTKKSEAAYGKMRVWVHKAHGIPLKTELFVVAAATEPEKRLTVKKLAKKDDRWVVVDSIMETPSKGSSTRMIVAALDTKTPIPDSDLTREALER